MNRPEPNAKSNLESSVNDAAPTSGQQRLIVLDVLRGFALFGVLLVNLPYAALPMAAGHPGQDAGLSEVISWALVKGLAETKFVSLFSLLFGIGLVLQLTRAESKGKDTGFYLRRLAMLGAVGLVHGFFFWPGDILFPYAVAGFLLFLLRHRSPRALVAIAALLIVLGLALSTGMAFFDDDADTHELSELIGEEGTWSEVEARAWTEGPLRLTLSVRALEYAVWLVISSLISFNWHVLGLFCLGAALMKIGALDARHRRRHGQIALGGLLGGLALEAAAISLWLKTDFAPGLTNSGATLLHEIGSLVLAAGYVGAIAWLIERLVATGLHRPLSAVGRTALTSYLGQSLAFNLLFPWFGLGLWGQLDRPQLIGLTLGIYSAQAVIAVIWLRFFAMGPCEWLWRWWTYQKRPPLRVDRAAA